MAQDAGHGQSRRERSSHRGRLVWEGVLADHYREGRTYRPPMAALDAFETVDWARDDLPDLLWPVLMVAEYGDGAAGRLGSLQAAAAENVGDARAYRLDGRLTSLEDFPEQLRSDVLALRAQHQDAVPPALAAVADRFPGMPGAWFIRGWWDGHELPTPDQGLDEIARAIIRVVADGHREDLVKFVPLCGRVVPQTGSFDREIVDALHDYPGEPSEFPMADTIVRSVFGAFRGAMSADRHGAGDPIENWGQLFWDRCWKLSPCMPEEFMRGDDQAAGESASQGDDEPEDELGAQADEAAREITETFNEFFEAVFVQDVDADLYRPPRLEVSVGLASRAARTALVYAMNPDLWASEHLASALRVFAETEILLRWMDSEGDEWFERYERYGAGKRKLARKHLEALADELDEAAPDEIQQAIDDQLRKEGGGALDVQEVSLDSTFAGRTLRQMAEECGALDLYRHVFQSASSIVHGEWWTIDDYAMQRCMNPLHRFHRMPSLNAASYCDPRMGAILSSRLSDVCDLALRCIAEPDTRNP